MRDRHPDNTFLAEVLGFPPCLSVYPEKVLGYEAHFLNVLGIALLVRFQSLDRNCVPIQLPSSNV